MPQLSIQKKISLGESVSLEFKKCSNGIHSDVYETVCSFLNRFGGEILLGVEDDGTVTGIPQKAVNDLIRNFINCINNPALFNPVCSATIEPVFIDDKIILKIFVPNASNKSSSNMRWVNCLLSECLYFANILHMAFIMSSIFFSTSEKSSAYLISTRTRGDIR